MTLPDTVHFEGSVANMAVHSCTGRQQREDLVTMIQRYPVWNEYWEDKRAKIEKITVPAYIVASYSSGIHSEGTLRGYEESSGPKW